MKSGYIRTAAILFAIALGALVPSAHSLAWLIRWLIMLMLFGVFLQVKLTRASLHRSHAYLLLANLVMGFASWLFGWLIGGHDVALACFFAGITPTASAAPVIISFLRGRVDYVIAAFVITNLSVAAVFPFILPLVLNRVAPVSFGPVLGSVALIIFVPLGVAWLVRSLYPPAIEWPGRWRNVSFGIWTTAMFLITANASDFVRRQADTPKLVVIEILITSMVVCAANFVVGRWVGGRTFPREASQSLGQKNTSFTIYLALTYVSPLVALGPTCYVIWHNLWNSWQLHQVGRQTNRHAPNRPP